jgi:hypothetical protein
MRVSANKDTAAVASMVQKWRKPTNPMSQGRLGSYVEPKRQSYEDVDHQALNMEAKEKQTLKGRSLNSFCIGTPHADTGVREIRELIGSCKAFAVLTSISLIPQIARGTNEKEFDEAVAVKVDGMIKLIMASTADAWLIHLPGMSRKHEVFTAESSYRIWRTWMILLTVWRITKTSARMDANLILSLFACFQSPN